MERSFSCSHPEKRIKPSSAVSVGTEECLLPIPGKSLEKLTVRRLSSHLIKTNNTRHQQYGFKAGLCMDKAIERVTDFIRESKERNLRTCLLALDFKGAFDNAWHPKILERLRQYRCPYNIYQLSKHFLSDRTASIQVANHLAKKSTTKGCLQGSVSGPSFWNILAKI